MRRIVHGMPDLPKNDSGVKVDSKGKTSFQCHRRELYDRLESGPGQSPTVTSVGTGSPGAVTSVGFIGISQDRTGSPMG
jgi:hypothetical protein